MQEAFDIEINSSVASINQWENGRGKASLTAMKHIKEFCEKHNKTPLVSNASVDNGVMCSSNLNPLNKGNSLSCSDTTLGAETMYHQKTII